VQDLGDPSNAVALRCAGGLHVFLRLDDGQSSRRQVATSP
jgi:hypothetical protein